MKTSFSSHEQDVYIRRSLLRIHRDKNSGSWGQSSRTYNIRSWHSSG